MGGDQLTNFFVFYRLHSEPHKSLANCGLSGGFDFVGKWPRTRKNTVELDKSLTRQGAGLIDLRIFQPGKLNAKNA